MSEHMGEKIGQYAGRVILPTLSRLVLAMAFVTAGYGKIFTMGGYSDSDVKILESLGVQMYDREAEVSVADSQVMVLTLFRQDDGGSGRLPWLTPAKKTESGQDSESTDAGESGVESPPVEPPVEKPPVEKPPAEKPPVEAAGQPPAESSDQSAVEESKELVEEKDGSPNGAAGDGYRFEQKNLHHVTLLLHHQGWQYPKALAWVAALTELVGGSLILLGVFSRIWGLGLAIAMGVAFCLTSRGLFTDPGLFGLSVSQYQQLYVQLGLFVLAFGVLLTGPGPLSVDRWLFRSRIGSSKPPVPPKQKKVMRRKDTEKPTPIPIPKGKPLTDIDGEFEEKRPVI